MALVIEVKVIPSSGRQKFLLDKSGRLKCFLKSPPEKGKANEELIKLICQKLRLIKDKVTILIGARARQKKIKIDDDVTWDQLLVKLGIERQLKI